MVSKGRPVTVDRSYANDPYVRKWLTGLSKTTQGSYTRLFVEWQNFIGMTPSAQIQKRVKDLTSEDLTERLYFENKFREFKELLERTKGKASTVTSYLKITASFFGRNGLPLALKKGDWKTTLPEQVTRHMELKVKNVKSAYGFAKSPMDRALLLLLAQSGISEIDALLSRIEDFPELYTLPETEHMFFEKPREKTGEIQATCISLECLHDLRIMLAERNNPKEGYLFVSTTKGKNDKLEVRSINTAIKSIFDKVLGEKARDFKTKMPRSFYNSALLRASIQSEIKDVMMGHARFSARKKYAYDETTIKENYAKAFAFLTINGIQTRQDIVKLREEMQNEQVKNAQLIGRMQTQIDDVNPIAWWWGKKSPPAPANADINGDGKIDISDINPIAWNWGKHI
jgi:hypothetical protein